MLGSSDASRLGGLEGGGGSCYERSEESRGLRVKAAGHQGGGRARERVGDKRRSLGECNLV